MKLRAKPGLASAVILILLAASATEASAATEVKRYRAWTTDGTPLVDEFSESRGECGTESFKTSREDAWRCFAGSMILDPCFENPVLDDEVLCVSLPWARTGVLVRSNLERGNHGQRPGGRPWALVLSSGKRCGLLGGATAVGPGGHRLNYACGRSARGGFLFGIPNRKRPTWTIRFSRTPDVTRYRRVKIQTAWR